MVQARCGSFIYRSHTNYVFVTSVLVVIIHLHLSPPDNRIAPAALYSASQSGTMATDEEKRMRKQKKKEAKLAAVAAVDAGTWVV